MKTTNPFISFIFLLGIFPPPIFSECSDWYSSTLECVEYRKKLTEDSKQNICSNLIGKYPKNKKDLESLNKISFCLQHVTHESKLASHQKAIVDKMPDEESWYFDTLKKLRINKDLPKARNIAYLCELKSPHSSLIRSELSEIYLMDSDFIEAGKSYLKELGLNRMSPNSVKFQITNLIRVAQIEYTPQDLLDSLINTTLAQEPVSLKILGELCLQNNYYKGALACYIGRRKLGDITWNETKRLIQKFNQEEIHDFAEFLLSDYPWKSQDKETKSDAFALFLKTHFQLKNWETINREVTNYTDWPSLTWELRYYIATSLIRGSYRNQGNQGNQGNQTNQDQALAQAGEILKKIMSKAPSPWSYNAVFSEVERRVLKKEFKAASKLLQKEKDNKNRLEGSGTILFWMGVVSLFQESYKEADSLLVLATAYVNEEHTTRALQFRNWLMIDTLKENRKHFFRGIAESGLSPNKRITSLKKVPEKSPLWPHARFEMASILFNLNEADSAQIVLNRLIKNNNDHWMTLNAKALKAYQEEGKKKFSKSIAIYNEILVKYQKGVISEFSRERIQTLKKKQVKK